MGVPFSDPVADGLLSKKRTYSGTFTQALVEALKNIETEIPLVIMTYFNPLFRYSVGEVVKDLADTAVRA